MIWGPALAHGNIWFGLGSSQNFRKSLNKICPKKLFKKVMQLICLEPKILRTVVYNPIVEGERWMEVCWKKVKHFRMDIHVKQMNIQPIFEKWRVYIWLFSNIGIESLESQSLSPFHKTKVHKSDFGVIRSCHA